jgi:small subunit ribosomal protein S1
MSRSEEGVSASVWEDFIAAYRVGDIVGGRVTKVVPFGAIIEVADGIPGLLVAEAKPPVGAEIAVRIKEIDHEKRRLSLQSS